MYRTLHLVQRRADRVLEPIAETGVERHRHRTVGGPVGVFDAVADLPGRGAAEERHGLEDAGTRWEGIAGAQRQREFAFARDAVDVGVGEPERTRFGTRRADREGLGPAAVPRRTVDDRVAVWREPRAPQRAADGRSADETWAVERPNETIPGRRRLTPRSPTRRRPLAAAASHARDRDGVLAGTAWGADADERSSSAKATSRADWNRSCGCFSRRPMHDAVKAGRNRTARAGKIRRIVVQHRRHRVGARIALKRPAAREHLVEHGSEAEDVGARVDRLPAHLLGRHVADGAEHGARSGLRRSSCDQRRRSRRPSAWRGRSRGS